MNPRNPDTGSWPTLLAAVWSSRPLCALLPVVVLLAEDATVLAEAGELRLQVEFTLAALEAAHVPLFVHGQQVVAVRDLPAAARAQSHALAGHTRHGLQVSRERGTRTQRQNMVLGKRNLHGTLTVYHKFIPTWKKTDNSNKSSKVASVCLHVQNVVSVFGSSLPSEGHSQQPHRARLCRFNTDSLKK